MNEFEDAGNATVDAQVTTEATTQAQPAAKQSDDFESRVNAQVETILTQRLSSEIQRGVQSELQKRKNRADKELAEERRSIERMKQRGQLDEEKATELTTAAEKAAEASRAVWHYEEEPTYQAPAQPIQRQSEPSSPPQADTETRFRQYIKDTYLFDPKDEKMEYAEILNADINDERVQAFLDVATTKRTEIRKRRINAESVKKGIDEYGPTGGLTTGNAAPMSSRLEQATDPDEIMDIATDEEWEKINRGRR
jgi:hypothetical protein